jgi:hypothetical protein
MADKLVRLQQFIADHYDCMVRYMDYLAANKVKDGVKTTESGLQYTVVKEGTGPKPNKDQLVTAHNRGTLIDGKQFDSSYDRKEPSTFRLSGVIPGWTEGLQLMSVGSKWELYIPAKLGYGEQGSGPIGPSEALIFEVVRETRGRCTVTLRSVRPPPRVLPLQGGMATDRVSPDSSRILREESGLRVGRSAWSWGAQRDPRQDAHPFPQSPL